MLDKAALCLMRLEFLLASQVYSIAARYTGSSLKRLEYRGAADGYRRLFNGEFHLPDSFVARILPIHKVLILVILLALVMPIWKELIKVWVG